MRTTVNLEPDLAKKVKALAHRRGLSFKQALNEVISSMVQNQLPFHGSSYSASSG